MEEQPIVIPGTIWKDKTCTGKKYEPGTLFTYHVYLTPTAIKAAEAGKKLALLLLLEHNTDVMAPILSDLMDEEIIPPALTVFAYPGHVPATLPDGTDRGMRTEEFDEINRDFSDFLVEELVPKAVRCAKVKLDPSPDMHFITGGSSGGTLAFNGVWFRNDYFHRAFLSSPTFAAERGGDQILTIVRKSETKPIKMYLTNGTEEPAGVDGSSLYAALNAADTFAYCGYDFRLEQFPGEGHCCRRQDPCLWRRLSCFIWANWQMDPTVRPMGQQGRISWLLPPLSKWEPCKFTMPVHNKIKTAMGTYVFEGDTIYLEKKGKRTAVASDLGRITAIQQSQDLWRLYVASHDRKYLAAFSIFPDGTLGHRCKLAPVQLPHDCHYLGADDMALSPLGKVLIATELGIQGLAKSGMIELILPLPGDVKADKVAVKDGFLYASSGAKVFRRTIRTVATAFLGSWGRNHIIP